MEDRKTGLLEEARRCVEERDQKLQSNGTEISDVKVVCILDHVALENLEQMLRDLIEEASRWNLELKPTSLWWTSTYEQEEKLTLFGAPHWSAIHPSLRISSRF